MTRPWNGQSMKKERAGPVGTGEIEMQTCRDNWVEMTLMGEGTGKVLRVTKKID